MNHQLHRKQMLILLLAMVMAIASYWIPLPQKSNLQPGQQILKPELSDGSRKVTLVEPGAFAREPATAWRFPVSVRVPQTVAQPDAEVRNEQEARPAPSSLVKQFVDPREFGNGNTMPSGNPTLVPTKNPDH